VWDFEKEGSITTVVYSQALPFLNGDLRIPRWEHYRVQVLFWVRGGKVYFSMDNQEAGELVRANKEASQWLTEVGRGLLKKGGSQPNAVSYGPIHVDTKTGEIKEAASSAVAESSDIKEVESEIGYLEVEFESAYEYLEQATKDVGENRLPKLEQIIHEAAAEVYRIKLELIEARVRLDALRAAASPAAMDSTNLTDK